MKKYIVNDLPNQTLTGDLDMTKIRDRRNIKNNQ